MKFSGISNRMCMEYSWISNRMCMECSGISNRMCMESERSNLDTVSNMLERVDGVLRM